MSCPRALRWGVAATWLLLNGCQERKEAPPVPAPPDARAPVVVERPAPAPAEVPAPEPEDLTTEAPEADPESKTVKLRLDVAPRSAKPVVWWGRQKLGEPPLTIERPRRSGPMNLVIKANGYLDHHTRLFTDRDDRLSVVLVRPTDAVTMLGYKRKPGMLVPGVSPDAGVPPPAATGAAPAAETAPTLPSSAAEPESQPFSF